MPSAVSGHVMDTVPLVEYNIPGLGILRHVSAAAEAMFRRRNTCWEMRELVGIEFNAAHQVARRSSAASFVSFQMAGV